MLMTASEFDDVVFPLDGSSFAMSLDTHLTKGTMLDSDVDLFVPIDVAAGTPPSAPSPVPSTTVSTTTSSSPATSRKKRPAPTRAESAPSPLSPSSLSSSLRSASSTPRTSMDIYMDHIVVHADGTVDASGVIGKACFDAWVASRKKPLKNPALSYCHTLRSTVTGDSKTGRNPFPPHVEAAVLKLFRQRRVWPAFQGTKCRFGSRGMFVTGFHEGKQQQQQQRQRVRPSAPVRSLPSTALPALATDTMLPAQEHTDVLAMWPSSFEPLSNVAGQAPATSTAGFDIDELVMLLSTDCAASSTATSSTAPSFSTGLKRVAEEPLQSIMSKRRTM